MITLKEDSLFKEEIAARTAFERQPENRVKVLPALEKPHPIVAHTKEVLSRYKERHGMHSTLLNLPVIALHADAEIMDRLLRISDALFKALEKRGETIATRDEKGETINVTFIIKGVAIKYYVEEVIKAVTFFPETAEDYRLSPDQMPKKRYIQTGLLRLKGGRYPPQTIMTERKNNPIEYRLNSFICGLYRQAYKTLDDRIESEKYYQKRRAMDARLERFKRYLQEKEEKIEDLKSMAAAHHEAGLIRKLLHDMEAAGTLNDPEWMVWARKYADEVDPVGK